MYNHNLYFVLAAILAISVLVAGAYNLFFKKNNNKNNNINDLKKTANSLVEVNKPRSIEESVRQIGLIDKDDFETHYKPLIEKVKSIEKLVGVDIYKNDFFEIAYRNLRKRRATVFVGGDSEKDRNQKGIWTYALFVTLAIRYVTQLLKSCEVKKDGEVIDPILLSINELQLAQYRPTTSNKNYPASPLNIHQIRNFIPNYFISKLNDFGLYHLVCKAVIGINDTDKHPFLKIIKNSENNSSSVSEPAFTECFNTVIELINENVYPINEPHGAIFESLTAILIDRIFLWEIYRAYSFIDSNQISKVEFEDKLHDELSINISNEKRFIYYMKIDCADEEGNDMKMEIELMNLIALPYSKFPNYTPKAKKRITKEQVVRTVTPVIDESDQQSNEDIESQYNKNEAKPGKVINTKLQPPKTKTKKMPDLFTDD